MNSFIIFLGIQTSEGGTWWCSEAGECVNMNSGASSSRCCFFSNQTKCSISDRLHMNENSFEKENKVSRLRMDICSIDFKTSKSCLMSQDIPKKSWGGGEYPCLSRSDEFTKETIEVFSQIDGRCSGIDDSQNIKNLIERNIILNENCFEKSTDGTISTESFMTERRLDEECYRNNYWYCKNRMQCIHPNLVCNNKINCADGSDESLNLCNRTITLKCDFNQGNSVLCPNGEPPFKTICARRCDGVSECIGRMDEENCETAFERIASCEKGYESLRKLIIVIASLTLIVTTLAVSLFWKKTISFLHDIGQVEKTVLKEPDQSRKTVTKIINVFQHRDFT